MCIWIPSKDKEGVGPAKKPTNFLTNSIGLVNALNKRCGGCERHVHLVEGRASAAQQYPRELCRAVTKDIIEQARLDSSDLFSFDCADYVSSLDAIDSVDHDESDGDGRYFWDDTSGKVLGPKLTRAARAEEVEAIRTIGVYRKVPITQCLEETGKRPIGTRWVDTNKGDKIKPKVRSRLVAQEINRHKMPELFAATPPLEYMKYLISLCASSQWTSTPTRLMISDVKKAYFYAAATRRVYVALPAEDISPGEEGMCGMLERSLYGTRDAAFNWTETYTKVLCESLGFEKGESSPCTFYHRKRCLKTVVHGDDFFTEGTAAELKKFDADLKNHFEMKTETLGPDSKSGEVQEVRFLNRILSWTDKGISWEEDRRHAEMVVKQLSLEGSRAAATPGVEEDNKTMADDSHCPSAEEEASALMEDETAKPMHLERRGASDEILAYLLGHKDIEEAISTMEDEASCSSDDWHGRNECIGQVLDRLEGKTGSQSIVLIIAHVVVGQRWREPAVPMSPLGVRLPLLTMPGERGLQIRYKTSRAASHRRNSLINIKR